MLPRPVALLLDFGGVLADAPPPRTPPPELVLRVYNLIGGVLTPGEIQRSLADGAAAHARWRDEDHPDELSQAEVWDRFVIGDWPRTAQAAVRAMAGKLSYDLAYRNNWALRPGIPEALDLAAGRGLPMAVVSNTLCGAAHRDFLAKAGVGRLFATQIYSPLRPPGRRHGDPDALVPHRRGGPGRLAEPGRDGGGRLRPGGAAHPSAVSRVNRVSAPARPSCAGSGRFPGPRTRVRHRTLA